MVDNEDGVQHRRNLSGESLSNVAPGQLPRDQHGQATPVADDRDEVLGDAPAPVTQSSRNSPAVGELPIGLEDRLFDSPAGSPQISAMDSTPSNEGRYITEEDSMPPTLREARPFFRSPNPFVASAAAPNMNASLGDLHAVLADTSQTETQAILAEQAARIRMHNAAMEVQQATEHLGVTRRVSQNTRRRIQEYQNNINAINANRVFGTREQIESQGDEYVSPISAMFERFEHQSTAQRTTAVALTTSSTTQATRSHSHPSRRDESRTDQSSPSSSSSNMFSSPYLGPLSPRASELAPSALSARDRVMMESRNFLDLMENEGRRRARNIHPSIGSTNHPRQANVQTPSTGNPPVFANLTNAVERPSSRAPRHGPSNDGRSFPGRQRTLQIRPGNSRRPSHIQRRPQDPREELEEYLMSLHTADASSRIPPPNSIEEANRRLPENSTPQPMSAEERNRRLIEANAWNPPSSDPDPSVGFANANPFGSSSLDNQRSNPLREAPRAPNRSAISIDPASFGPNIMTLKPPPKTKAEMTVDIECKICMEQPATVACLPCGHCVMCRWCSEIHVPSRPNNWTKPRKIRGEEGPLCPLCRTPIETKQMIYFG